MKVDLSHPEKNVALLSVDVETDRIAQVRQRVYRRLVRTFNIPGFRKGKAPQAILERYVGPEAFDKEVLDELLPEAYDEAITQSSIEPVAEPEVEVTQWQRGEPLLFKVTVATKPEVILGQYTGLEVPREAAEVPEEAVDSDLALIQRRMAELVDAPEDALLATGSVAVIDFAATVDGEPLEGGSAQDFPLELGSGQFVPGFEDQLIGLKAGDQRDLSITFPSDYQAGLAGKEALFSVTVKAHRVHSLPELNDALAVKAAPMLGLKADEEGFGLDRLRSEMRRRLEAGAENKTRVDFERRVIERVVGNAQVEVPAVMVDNRAVNIRRDFAETLQRRNLSFEEYLTASGQTAEDLDAGFRLRAEAEVRRELVLETIARKEGITASEQETDERITTMARLYGQDPARLREALEQGNRRSEIAAEIVARKTIDYLVGAQVPVPVAAAPEDVSTEVGQVEGQPATPQEERRDPEEG